MTKYYFVDFEWLSKTETGFKQAFVGNMILDAEDYPDGDIYREVPADKIFEIARDKILQHVESKGLNTDRLLFHVKSFYKI